MSETVGDRLKELRRRAGSPTQKVVANAVGCAYRSYQNWEQGAVTPRGAVITPSWKNAEALARFYGTSPEYIVYGIDGDAPTRVELEQLDAKLDAVLGALLVLTGGELPAGVPDPRARSGSSRRSRPGGRGTGHPLVRQEVVF